MGVENLGAELEAAALAFQLGRLERTGNICRRILETQDKEPQANFLLGLVAQRLGNHQSAIPHFETAIAMRSGNAGDHHHLALSLRAIGQSHGAIEHFRRAVQCDPNSPMIHTCLGNALRQLGKHNESIASHKRALRLFPTFAEGHANLSLALRESGDMEEACESSAKAVALCPDSNDFRHNHGNTLLLAGRYEEAKSVLESILLRQPEHARARNDLAYARKNLGDLDGAVNELRQTLATMPAFADAHYNLGLALLQKGDFATGFLEYEWRHKIAGSAATRFSFELWERPLREGDRLLIHAEQGLGDTIQFSRFVPLLRQRHPSVRISFEGVPRMRSLLSNLCPRYIDRGTPTDNFDLHIPLLSLPAKMGIDRSTLSGEAYMAADPQRVAHWRARLAERAPAGGTRIGISWQGNPAYRADRERSIPLSEFSALAQLPNVTLVSLQNGPAVESLCTNPIAIDLGDELDRDNAFVDTAAVMENLDLVVCSDSAVAHLAGALGIRCWLALPTMPDWRWELTGSETPWYESMRLFRQSQPRKWQPVFQEIITALPEAT